MTALHASAATAPDRPPSFALGLAAALASVAIGVGWQVATRLGTTTTLAPIDLALFRYAVPALVLAPLWLRAGLVPAGVGRGTVALMVLGAGLPFGLAAMAGAQFAPTAHMAVLLPGTMPLFVAMLAMAVLGERPAPVRLAGLALILVLYTYGGWNDAAFIVAEMKDKRRSIPRALLLGTAGVALIYLLVNAAYLNAPVERAVVACGRPLRSIGRTVRHVPG